jgi:hypothetical protein
MKVGEADGRRSTTPIKTSYPDIFRTVLQILAFFSVDSVLIVAVLGTYLAELWYAYMTSRLDVRVTPQYGQLGTGREIPLTFSAPIVSDIHQNIFAYDSAWGESELPKMLEPKFDVQPCSSRPQ